MADAKTSDADIERLAAAVADRFNASSRTVHLAASQATRTRIPGLVDRLASAVGQRLAARAGTNIDRLASAVAQRLAASTGAARLASSAARHFAGDLVWGDPELDRLVVGVAGRLKA